MGGTTIKSFTSAEGVHGLFQNELAVHGKKDGVCPTSGEKIIVTKVGGRGTYFCPKCQKWLWQKYIFMILWICKRNLHTIKNENT